MTTRFEVPHHHLTPEPTQVRKTKQRIGELAESIELHGLLENLVVREDPDRKDRYYIVAGERRWLAIGVLIKDGRWLRQRPVPVVVIDGDGLFENIVENVVREDVPPWELGHRLNEIIECGHTQRDVATRIGKSQGFVSRHVNIARGLDASTIEYFRKTNMTPSGNDLVRISALVKRDGTPDAKAQLETARRLRGLVGIRKKRRPNRNLEEKEQVYLRFRKLQTSAGVPPHAEPYVLGVVRYLQGKDRKLTFKL